MTDGRHGRQSTLFALKFNGFIFHLKIIPDSKTDTFASVPHYQPRVCNEGIRCPFTARQCCCLKQSCHFCVYLCMKTMWNVGGKGGGVAASLVCLEGREKASCNKTAVTPPFLFLKVKVFSLPTTPCCQVPNLDINYFFILSALLSFGVLGRVLNQEDFF